MSRGRQSDRDRFNRPSIVVPEVDNYLPGRQTGEEPSEPPNGTTKPATWIYTLFQPAVVTVLIGCITWSVAQAIAPLTQPSPAETLNGALFIWAVSVVMTFIGFRTQRVVMKRYLSGNDATRARLIELAILFLGVKLLHHLGDTIPELLRVFQGWAQAPFSFFDTESIVAYLIGIAGWFAAGLTARDLDEIIDPMRTGAASPHGETDPRQRIVARYFIGAAVLLFFTAVNRVSGVRLLQMTNERISAPIGNVLLYFLLGILMLGQLQWMRLTALWQRQKVSVASDLAPTWLRYTLLFVGLAALLAFLLPTGYTVGILDLVTMAFLMISYFLTLIYLLLLWPIIMLMSLLLGKGFNAAPLEIERPPFAPPPAVVGAEGSPWWDVVRSVLFWLTLLVVVVTLVRSYIRDRPGLLQALRRITPRRWAVQLWRGLRRWLSALGRKLPAAIPALVRRLRRAAARQQARSKRVRGLSTREQIIYHYMTTLDRAREWGVGRRQTETPYEYRKTLAPHLNEGQDAMESLTEAFVAARYSTYTFTQEEVEAQASNAAAVRFTDPAQQPPKAAGPERDPGA